MLGETEPHLARVFTDDRHPDDASRPDGPGTRFAPRPLYSLIARASKSGFFQMAPDFFQRGACPLLLRDSGFGHVPDPVSGVGPVPSLKEPNSSTDRRISLKPFRPGLLHWGQRSWALSP